MIRRVFIAAAFAVWCFLPAWVNLAEGDQAYFARLSPARAVLLPDLCWQAAIALVMLAATGASRRKPRRAVADRLFLLACLVPLGAAGNALVRVAPFDLVGIIRHPSFWPVVLVLGLPAAVYAWRRSGAASRAARGVLLYSWPVLALLIAQTARLSLRYPPGAFADRPLASSLPTPPSRRVVWILFDELSQDVAFAHRPASVSLPEFDRLRAGSFSAMAAHSPSGSTLTSLPSLILGRDVASATPLGPGRLSLEVTDSAVPVNWAGAPNVFDAVRRLGDNAAVAGWYHPYGRLFGRSVTRCYWVAGWLNPGVEEPSHYLPLPDALGERAGLALRILPVVGHLPGVDPERPQRVEKLERLSALLDRAQSMAADPSIGLAFLHLPAPHPPAVYDRRTGRFTAARGLSYLDGVAAADAIFGRLRRAMESAGLWDRTAVLVSSDHGWRTSLWRGSPVWTREDDATPADDPRNVPFLLKLPGQTAPLSDATPFDTVVTRRVVEAILAGRLSDPSQITHFIGH